MKNYSMRRLIWVGLLTAAGMALLLSSFASKSPDGLERVAEDKGFLDKGEASSPYQAPVPGYTVPGVKAEWLSTPIAGVLGTLLTFGFAYGVAQTLSWRRRQNPGR